MNAKTFIERLEQAAVNYAAANKRVTTAIIERDKLKRDFERKRADLLAQSVDGTCHISREQREGMITSQLQTDLDALAIAKEAVDNAQLAQFEAKMEWLCSREVAHVWANSAEANHG